MTLLRRLRTNALVAGLVAAVAACAPASGPVRPGGHSAGSAMDVNDLLIVDCMLPGQIRRLGGMTYLTARRPIKTTAHNCELRGGEYVAYDRASDASSLKVWLPRAQQGDAEAQTYVGELYEKGLGGQPDYSAAAHWYRKAAEQGNSRAAINLGYLYERGLGVKPDKVAALNWYRRASGLKDADLVFGETAAQSAARNQELATLRTTLEDREQQIRELQAQLAKTRHSLDRRRRQLDGAQREIDRTRTRLQELKRQDSVSVPQAGGPAPANTTGQLAARQEALDRHLIEVRDKEQQVRQLLQQQRRQAQLLRKELAAGRDQLAAYEARLQRNRADLERRKEQLEEEKAALQRQVSSSTNNAAAVQRLRRELARKQDLIHRLEQELQGDAARKQALQAARTRQSALQEDVAAKDQETAALRKRLTQAQEQLAQIQRSLQRQRQQTAATEAELRQELADLRRQRQTADQGRIEQLDQAVRERQAELDTQRLALAKVEQQARDSSLRLSQALQAAQSKQQGLRRYIAKQQDELDGLREELGQARKERDQAQQRLAAKEQELSTERERFNRALSAREQQTQAAQRVRQQREAEIARLQKELTQRQARIDRERAEVERLAAEAGRYRKQLARLETSPRPTPKQSTAATDDTPRIEIIEPKLVTTRGSTREHRLLSGSGVPVVVGKVTAPAGVKVMSVNDRRVDVDPQGMFVADIPVGEQTTPVRVALIDAKGRRAVTEFLLVPRSTVAAPPKAPIAGFSPALARKEGIEFGNYYALVIGNDRYRKLTPLTSAVYDARSVAEVLRSRYGFRVTLLTDATKKETLSALLALQERLGDDDNLLIYYAGHGHLDASGQGYWQPVDADPARKAGWISNDVVTDYLNLIQAKHILVVADSCYSGSLTGSLAASLSAPGDFAVSAKWLKVMSQKRARLVLTSGGLAPVLDTGSGGHSIFAQAFLEVLGQDNVILDSNRVFLEVAQRVRNNASRLNVDQLPQYGPVQRTGHEFADFLFVPESGGLSIRKPRPGENTFTLSKPGYDSIGKG